MNAKIGRPPKYPYDQLRQKLIEYAKIKSLGKITYTKLQEFTGIPFSIWRDNKKIKNDIIRLNQDMFIFELVSEEIKELPNLLNMVERNYHNKAKVIDYLSRYANLVNNLYNKALLYDKTFAEKEKIEIDLKKVKEELEKSKKNEKMYKEELDRIMISSTSMKNREQLGIREDMLNILKNRELAGAVGLEIKRKFMALFPDENE